jgi:hypothetical protein
VGLKNVPQTEGMQVWSPRNWKRLALACVGGLTIYVVAGSTVDGSPFNAFGSKSAASAVAAPVPAPPAAFPVSPGPRVFKVPAPMSVQKGGPP